MTRETVCSIWLVPNAAETRRIQSIIDDIASKQGGVSFQPHLTLGSLSYSAPDFAHLCQGARPFQLNPIEIDATPAFTTSLFIRFAMSDELSSLRTALENLPAFRSSRAFDPHLSLSYGAPPVELDVDRLRSDLLAQPILFDTIWAVEIGLPVATYEDVKSWRVLKKRSL